jgi:hypothetical protein
MSEDEVRNALVQWLYDEGRTKIADGTVEVTIFEDSSAELTIYTDTSVH